jgi:hypothetical protein
MSYKRSLSAFDVDFGPGYFAASSLSVGNTPFRKCSQPARRGIRLGEGMEARHFRKWGMSIDQT